MADMTRLKRHVTLKVYTRGDSSQEEFQIYKRISDANPAHPGHRHMRTALGQFTIERPGGKHLCLVQKPMWDSFGDLLYRNPQHRFTPELLKIGLMQIFLALDYLHTECRLVHTGMYRTLCCCCPCKHLLIWTPNRHSGRQHTTRDYRPVNSRSLR